MEEDFKARLAAGTLLEPSPVDEPEDAVAAGGATGAGAAPAAAPAAQQQPAPDQPPRQQHHRSRWLSRQAASGASLPSSAAGSPGTQRRGGAANRLGPGAAVLPIGPRNIPLESQPEPQALLYDGSSGPAPSLMLAGINLQPQRAQQGQQGRVAPMPARRTGWGPRSPAQAGVGGPAAQAPVHGSGRRAEQSPGRPAPQPAAGAGPARAASAATAPAAAQPSTRSVASAVPAGAAGPADATEPPRRSVMHQYRLKRPEEVAAAAARRLRVRAAAAAPTRWPVAPPPAAPSMQQQQQPELPGAGQVEAADAPAVSAADQPPQVGRGAHAAAGAAGGAGNSDAQQPDAKRRRTCAAPPEGVTAAAAAEANAALESAVAAMRRQDAPRPQSPPQAGPALLQEPQHQMLAEFPAARAARRARVAAAEQQWQQQAAPAGPLAGRRAQLQAPPVQRRPLPAAGWSAPQDEAGDLAFQQGAALLSAWQDKAPSPSKLNPAGQLLPPGGAVAPAAAGMPPHGTAEGADVAPEGKGAAAMAVDSSPEDEEFHDAREHLEGSQQAQQAQQGAAAGAALPPGALHLRTQPDEVQWTNLHDLEPAESLPETQVVNENRAPLVVPGTEEPAELPVQQPEQPAEQPMEQPAEQQEQQVRAAAAAAPPETEPPAAGQGSADGEDMAPSPSPSAGAPAAAAAAAPAAEASREGSGSDSDTEQQGVRAVMELAARFRDAVVRGAKATAEGVELYVQWADGTSGRVPTSTLHELAHEDCLGCCVLGKLALFYESKTKTRKRGGSRGGGGGGADGE